MCVCVVSFKIKLGANAWRARVLMLFKRPGTFMQKRRKKANGQEGRVQFRSSAGVQQLSPAVLCRRCLEAGSVTRGLEHKNGEMHCNSLFKTHRSKRHKVSRRCVFFTQEERRKSVENGAPLPVKERRESGPSATKTNDLFSVHDFDIKIAIDVPAAGTC